MKVVVWDLILLLEVGWVEVDDEVGKDGAVVAIVGRGEVIVQ